MLSHKLHQQLPNMFKVAVDKGRATENSIWPAHKTQNIYSAVQVWVFFFFLLLKI